MHGKMFDQVVAVMQQSMSALIENGIGVSVNGKMIAKGSTRALLSLRGSNVPGRIRRSRAHHRVRRRRLL